MTTQPEYVVVPREPTQAMGDAARRWQHTDYVCDPEGARNNFYDGVYRAMLAAAPKAPEQTRPSSPGAGDSSAQFAIALEKAGNVIRSIAAMGHDSTDKEVADEALRIARLWVADDTHDLALHDARKIDALQQPSNECPNCVSPWKCNGPHIGDAPLSGYEDLTCVQQPSAQESVLPSEAAYAAADGR